MNSDVFIPARMESERLPGKQLKKINDTPVLKILVDRLRITKKVRKIIVCTTTLESDNPLVKFCEKENISFFRGSPDDILVRFLDAAKFFETDIIIDVEGDKIYTDPVYVDKVIEEMENSQYDYVEGFVSNKKEHHGVHGIVPAGIRRTVLEKICKLKKDQDTSTGYREFFLFNKFIKSKFIKLDSKISFPENIRLTLDYPEDFELAKEIFRELGNKFHVSDILALIDKKPELLEITKPVLEKWLNNYNENIMDFSLNHHN